MAANSNSSGGGEVSKGETGVDHERLWQAADKLRGSIDAAEYKHVVLGLIFLKYISDSFEARRAKLAEELAADGIEGDQAEKLLESRDGYAAENVFWVPPEARWQTIQDQARQADIATLIDDGMYAIERDNPKLKGKFAAAEGKLGGEFFTPRSVVRLLVEMIEPYEGRVYDPCCGSGGMFVQSEKFAEAHGGSHRDISIFGQESNPTTWRLAHMNLALRGIEANLGEQPADSVVRDLHPDLKADYILANPPFNISDWSGDLLRDDVRWKFGVPPVGNANYAWIQHFIHHLAPANGHGGGIAGFVMANGSLSSNTGGEDDIRKNIIEADLVDCIIAMPTQLFLTTGIPVCLWFISRNKAGKPSPRPSPDGRGSAEQYRGEYDFEGLKKRARELRTKQTPPEAMFWELVRDRRFMELKFRRQHQIGDYIADFYCHEHKLIVELDGEIHNQRQDRDHKREAWLRSRGFTVFRFPNEDFVNDPERVLADIASTAFDLPPSTLGRGDGGEGNPGMAPYRDIPGFCKSAKLEEIKKHGHVLTPGRYVGAAEVEDDGEPFNEKMQRLTAELQECFAESDQLQGRIKANLKGVGYGG